MTKQQSSLWRCVCLRVFCFLGQSSGSGTEGWTSNRLKTTVIICPLIKVISTAVNVAFLSYSFYQVMLFSHGNTLYWTQTCISFFFWAGVTIRVKTVVELIKWGISITFLSYIQTDKLKTRESKAFLFCCTFHFSFFVIPIHVISRDETKLGMFSHVFPQSTDLVKTQTQDISA